MTISRWFVAGAAVLGLAAALFSVEASAAGSKFLGTWNADLSSAPPPAAGAPPPPKSVTLVTSDAGGGKWKTTIDVVGADDKTTHSEAVYSLDGKSASLAGDANAPVDSISVTMPDANTMVVKQSKDGKLVSTVTSTLSADGNTMTSKVEGTSPDGKPMTQTRVAHRAT